MDWQDKKLLVIAGPTAVGKTATAIAMAQYFQTEIVSADSRQIFKELTIGTAKPDKEELQRVVHHFIDSHSIHDDYDAARYGHEARERINDLFRKHDHVILCGGSGLYIKAVLEGFDDIPEVPTEIRDDLVHQYETMGIGWLQEKMQSLDPEHFAVVDQQNPHRLIRALEVKLGTGLSIASFHKKTTMALPYGVIKIGLALPRAILYQRIDERMDKMIAGGLFEEAEHLYPYREHNALQTVGYKEIFDFMEGRCDREEAIRLLKRNSRRYAKRQLTWFKKDEGMTWFEPHPLSALIDFVKTR